MVRIALVQPNADERYGARQAYESTVRPPETGLAVLSSYLRAHGHSEVICLDPDRDDEKIAERAAEYDVIGFTDWFSNHERVVGIAKMTKEKNPDAHVVVGGPNTGGVARLMLQKYSFIDTVVVRDGEQALERIVSGAPVRILPNCWYRDGNYVRFTHPTFTPMDALPLWDFESFEHRDRRLAPYLHAIASIGETGFDPWLVPPLTMFSFRGCMKAIKEGVCTYCTSAETVGRVLHPDAFWRQIEFLRQNYGATLFYMADDIFPVSLTRMEQLATAEPMSVPTPMIRAYAYMPDFIALTPVEFDRMIAALHVIGVFSLFFGVESFGLEQITRVNKAAVSIGDCKRVITALGSNGIRTTMAYLLGLPGESPRSCQQNLRSLEVLLATGHVERIYLSIVMALRGTPMFEEFLRTPGIVEGYGRAVGCDLASDDNPDYHVLQRLGVEHLTGMTPMGIHYALQGMIKTAEQYLPPHRVGGFLLDPV
ncbi:cobalamin B12-binding domain-containing protein [Candidatus Uhrbacteria bacterium]|nr:cobalamin B12-binding domain-containing protein [Candidatus Uhrbacteria bacterium]